MPNPKVLILFNLAVPMCSPLNFASFPNLSRDQVPHQVDSARGCPLWQILCQVRCVVLRDSAH